MSVRNVCLAATLVVFAACGQRPRIPVDGGIDAGEEEVDAGRQRGDDPPSGWQVVAPVPDTLPASALLGVSVTSAPDQFGQPMIAAVFEDPNGDLNYDDNRVIFTRWDGTAKAFTTQLTIEVIGGAHFEHPDRQVSIARDATTGRIAIMYVKPQDNTIRTAISDDDGAHFSLRTESAATGGDGSNPVVAMNGGTMHQVWAEGSTLHYRRRNVDTLSMDDSLTGLTLGSHPIALALDSNGSPGVAFFTTSGGLAVDLVYWNANSLPQTVVFGAALDVTPLLRRPSVSLTFAGTTPHLAYHLRKDAPGASPDMTTELWYVKALNAAGTSWSTPVGIPRNGSATTSHTTAWYQAIQIDAAGRVNVAGDFAANGASTACGGPKLSRAGDGMTFTTCAPLDSPLQTAGDWVTMWPHKAGKQTMIFHYGNRSNPSLKAGIVMWREP